MAQTITRPSAAARTYRRLVGRVRRRHVALFAILALAGVLGLAGLDREGYSNGYYAATVRSMLSSWHNFFYASFDPGGFVSVDKPPLGFWIQAASAAVFGFSGWSLLLPQVVSGVLSVAVLYRVVARRFGPPAGLIAGLVLAVTPIVVATNRNNTVDSLLMLTMLLASYAVIVAAERGSLRWLVIGFVLLGLGFNIKMLQAFLILPALVLVYALTARRGWLRRAAHLGVATVVLAAVSLAWVFAVDLTPADQRPFVGGSSGNSAVELAIGYNGLSRLTGFAHGIAPAPGDPLPAASTPLGVPPSDPAGAGHAGTTPGGPDGSAHPVAGSLTAGIGGEGGPAGPLRLLNKELSGQISWLLPIAAFGLVPAARRLRVRRGIDARTRATLMWLLWFLGAAAFFSVAAFWHRYYLVVMAPPIAALVGTGVAGLWQAFRRSGPMALLLPAALAATALLQLAILADVPMWSAALAPVIGVGTATVVVLLVLVRVRSRHTVVRQPGALRRVSAALLSAGLCVLLIGPVVWASIPVATAPGDALPAAGPREVEEDSGIPLTQPVGFDSAGQPDPKLLAFLLLNRGTARFIVATSHSGGAAPLILATGQPVMAMGGFGGDRILTSARLRDLVRQGVVRYFLLPSFVDPGHLGSPPLTGAIAPPPASPVDGTGDDASGWVPGACRRIAAELWQSDPGRPVAPGPGRGDILPGGEALYDCGAFAIASAGAP